MTRAKQKIVAIVLAAICLSAGIAGTVAYFTGASVSHNIIETAPGVSLSISGVEESIMPGSAIQDRGIVEAEANSAAAWVRMKVATSVQLANGETVTPPDGLIVINYNNEEWQDGGDGWWCYNNQLLGGETTTPLMKSVFFDGNLMDSAYKNAQVTVSVKAQGVQAKNNGSTVMEAQGWPQNTSD